MPKAVQAVSIASEKSSYSWSEAIALAIRRKNVSTEDIETSVAEPLVAYTIIVLLPDGKPAPMTRYGRQRVDASQEFVHEREVTLKPGEGHLDGVPLNKILDMT